MSINSEQFLANALQNGDQSAYEQLYCNLFDGATDYLSKTFELSKNDAYDIVSSVFAKLPEIIDKYDSTQNFIKWFHSVINNSARDYMKKESRSFPVEPEVLLQYVKNDDFDSEKDFERIERATQLHQIIAELSAKQCIAATLHYLQGCTIAETAEQMKIKPETVKEYLSRAKKVITKRVKTEGDHTHWLGVLIPRICAEISNKFEYFTNARIEAKTAVVTITAVAVLTGAVVPAQINDINAHFPKYIASQNSQEEIAAAMPTPQQINPIPIEQRHAEIKQISIPEIQEEIETPIRESNVESWPESDKGWNSPRSQQVFSENTPEVIIPNAAELQVDKKTQTKIHYITDDSGDVIHIIEEIYDENGNLIRVNRDGKTTLSVIGEMLISMQPSGTDNNEPTATSDEEAGEPNTADTDDSSNDGVVIVKYDKSLIGGPDCKLTDLTVVRDEYGNRYIQLKNDSNDNQIQDKIGDFNTLEDTETIDEENNIECEEPEETAELLQDTESLSSPEEPPDE